MKRLGIVITIVALIVSICMGAVGWSLASINGAKVDQIEKYDSRIVKVETENKDQAIKIESLTVNTEYLKNDIKEIKDTQKEILKILKERP